MPRFLHKNYSRLYAQEREDLFNRCLLVSPGAQFTSNSCIGAIQDQLYAPWEFDRVYSHLFIKDTRLMGERSVEEELKGLEYAVPLVESVSGCDWGVGEREVELEIADGWFDLSREIFYRDSTYVGMEYLPILDSLTEGVVSYLLEEMETCDYLSLIPDRYYPSVDKLVSRYKSRPVTDPLLGESGEFILTECEFLAEDKVIGSGVRNRGEDEFVEIFDREVTEEDMMADGSLSLFEDPDVAGWGASDMIDMLEEALHLRAEEMSPLSQVTDEKLRSDVKSLNPISVTELASGAETQLEISLTEEEAEDLHRTHISETASSLGELESPLVPDRLGPGLLSQLATDHSILPLTPFLAPRHFLSPDTVEKCERALRRTNQVPEELGCMMLVEPEATKQLYYPAVGELIGRLHMRLDDVSSLDMELRWDPLTQYYAIIEHTLEILVKQSKLEVKLSEVNGYRTPSVPLYMEDLTKYDSLLPDLERESLDSVDSSGCLQVTAAVTSLDWRVPLDDGISAKPKVHVNDHNSELETRTRIPRINNHLHTSIPRFPENSATQTGSVFNQFDDIDSFLLLRQKGQSSRTPSPRVNTNPKRVCLLASPKPSKLVAEQIPLNALYREVLSLLMSYGDPLLKQVQEYGHLHDSSFTTLLKSPHTLQFLLREYKHQWLEQDMPMDCAVWHRLRTICQLFCLVSSGTALLATSLNAAIDVLFEIVNKYKALVQDSLVTIGNSLVGMREKVQNSFHPKIIQTIYIIQQNEMKLTKFSNVGIIVFDIECTFNLAGEMIGILELQVTKLNINLVKAPCNETYNYYHEMLLNAFDTSHCLLCESSSLSYEHFPWEKVSLMILYNLDENSGSLSLIKERAQENCKIHFLRTSMDMDISQLGSSLKNASSENTQNPNFIICSTSVSDEHGLLELVESKCNISVIERDYRSLGLADYSPDFIVNASTCILLVHLSSLNSDANMEEIFNKLQNIRTAYTVCYILAYTRSTEEYMHGDTPNVLARLNSRISKLQDAHCTYKLKGSTETEGIASVIRSIVAQHSVGTYELEEVEIETSEQEKWLLSLKCINSCTALILLSKCPLRELIRQELDQLKRQYPHLPQQSLELFHQTCRQNYAEWSNLTVNTNSEKSKKLREAINRNSIEKNDLTDNISTVMTEEIQRNDTTPLYDDESRLKKNCSIMIANKAEDIRTGNDWKHTVKHINNIAHLSQNSNGHFMNKSDPSKIPTQESSQWLYREEVRPTSAPQGILAFQQQEGFPVITNNQCNKYRFLDKQEKYSSISGNELLPHINLSTSTDLFSTDSRSSGLMHNVRCANGTCHSLEKDRGARQKALSCKQVPGVTQTKLIFK